MWLHYLRDNEEQDLGLAHGVSFNVPLRTKIQECFPGSANFFYFIFIEIFFIVSVIILHSPPVRPSMLA